MINNTIYIFTVIILVGCATTKTQPEVVQPSTTNTSTLNLSVPPDPMEMILSDKKKAGIKPAPAPLNLAIPKSAPVNKNVPKN